jgi:hypothetical protein
MLIAGMSWEVLRQNLERIGMDQRGSPSGGPLSVDLQMDASTESKPTSEEPCGLLEEILVESHVVQPLVSDEEGACQSRMGDEE